MSMGIGTRLIGALALSACILCADAICDSPVALMMALGSVIVLAWIGGRNDQGV